MNCYDMYGHHLGTVWFDLAVDDEYCFNGELYVCIRVDNENDEATFTTYV